MDLPSFDGFTVQAKYSIMHGQRHSDEEAQAWKAVEAIIEQFKSADKYVLSTPMWNYSIPYRLKQYIDIIVQPGYTLYVDKQDQVANKPFLAIYARGGEHAGEPDDLQTKYIEVIFGAIGFTDIKSIIVEPTLQDGPDVTEKKVKAAIGSARKIAENF
jgi:FMN-dependent NADH-azoreductase